VGKRTVDVLIASVALLALAPLLLLIAVAIKGQDGGSVFYRGTRVGRGARPFRIFKFRTMVVDAERRGGPSTADDDPRITRVGRWLRKYKLDELPQFLNVLTGDMSIVGPRPEVAQYVALLRDEERIVLSVRPGLTDWASLWNSDEGAILAGAADPERVYLERIRPEKVRLQMAYVKERSAYVDLVIMLRTLAIMVFRRGAPAARKEQGETYGS
jgi:lipopolysaccharide/colanic/teichoic acid biosynthesis glycosyltransferase